MLEVCSQAHIWNAEYYFLSIRHIVLCLLPQRFVVVLETASMQCLRVRLLRLRGSSTISGMHLVMTLPL